MNKFNFKSSTESVGGEGLSPSDKKELSVIMEPSNKDSFSVQISPFDSPKNNSKTVSIADSNTLHQIGGIFSHKASPRVSRNVISKPSSERLFSIAKQIS